MELESCLSFVLLCFFFLLFCDVFHAVSFLRFFLLFLFSVLCGTFVIGFRFASLVVSIFPRMIFGVSFTNVFWSFRYFFCHLLLAAPHGRKWGRGMGGVRSGNWRCMAEKFGMLGGGAGGSGGIIG